MSKLGLSMVLENPVSPFFPSLVTRRFRGMSNGCPIYASLDPSEAEGSLHSRVTGGWKLVVTTPFHVWVLERIPLGSCSCDPDISCPWVLFLLNTDASNFPWFWEWLSILPLNFFVFLKILLSWFLYLSTETLIDIPRKRKLSCPVSHS